MDIDIYTSTTRDTFICVPKGTTPPAHLGALRKWKTVTLDPNAPRVGMDVKQVLADIAAQGYAVIGTEVVVEVGTVPPPAG